MRTTVLKQTEAALFAGLCQHDLVQQKRNRSLPLQDRKAVIHGSRKFRIGERDAAKGCTPQDLSRCRLTLSAKEESRLGANVGMTPPVQNDARDIPLSVKSGVPKHGSELFPDRPFIIPEWGSKH